MRKCRYSYAVFTVNIITKHSKYLTSNNKEQKRWYSNLILNFTQVTKIHLNESSATCLNPEFPDEDI